MIERIRSREVFERVTVISALRLPEAHQQLYSEFRELRNKRGFAQMEERRISWENRIKSRLKDEIEKDGKLVLREFKRDVVLAEIDAVSPLILLDIPIKSAAANRGADLLRYIREDPFVSHRFNRRSSSKFESHELGKNADAFDSEVGKIRVLADPRWRDMLIWILGEKSGRSFWPVGENQFGKTADRFSRARFTITGQCANRTDWQASFCAWGRS